MLRMTLSMLAVWVCKGKGHWHWSLALGLAFDLYCYWLSGGLIFILSIAPECCHPSHLKLRFLKARGGSTPEQSIIWLFRKENIP